MELRDGCRKFRGPVDALDVGFFRFYIQNSGAHGIVDSFTEQESLLVVFWGNSWGGKTGKMKPFVQCLGRRQKIPRVGATVPDSGGKVERQASCVESELVVFEVCVFCGHDRAVFCNHIYGYI